MAYGGSTILSNDYFSQTLALVHGPTTRCSNSWSSVPAQWHYSWCIALLWIIWAYLGCLCLRQYTLCQDVTGTLGCTWTRADACWWLRPRHNNGTLVVFVSDLVCSITALTIRWYINATFTAASWVRVRLKIISWLSFVGNCNVSIFAYVYSTSTACVSLSARIHISQVAIEVAGGLISYLESLNCPLLFVVSSDAYNLLWGRRLSVWIDIAGSIGGCSRASVTLLSYIVTWRIHNWNDQKWNL